MYDDLMRFFIPYLLHPSKVKHIALQCIIEMSKLQSFAYLNTYIYPELKPFLKEGIVMISDMSKLNDYIIPPLSRFTLDLS